MTLDEAVAALTAHTDRDEVVKLLESKAGSISHAIFQKGHDVGYGKKGKELTDAQARLTTLQEQVTTLEKEAKALREQNPDVAKVHAEYREQIKKLQTDADTALQKQRQEIRAERERGARHGLLDRLVGEHRIDRDYAQVLTERSDVVGRIQIDDSGSLTVMQAGKSIPVAARDGQSPLEVLAAELAKDVDPKWVTSTVDTGSGSRNSGLPNTGTGGVKKGANLYAQIREEQEKKLQAKREEAEAARKNLAAIGLGGSVPAV